MASAEKSRCSSVRQTEEPREKGERFCASSFVWLKKFSLCVTNGGGWGRRGGRLGALELDSLHGPNFSFAIYQLCNFVLMT